MYTYPRPQNLAYPARVLSVRGRFLEAILQRTERELAGPGRPGTADRLVAKVERREAPRPTSLGARGTLPREVGTLIPPPGVLRHCTLAPPAAPPPSRGSRGIGKPRTLCAARMWRLGCLKFKSKNFCTAPTNTPPSSRRTPGPIPSVVVMRKVSATCGSNSPNHNPRWLWVPAFAGTTSSLKPQHLRPRQRTDRRDQQRCERVPGRHEQR